MQDFAHQMRWLVDEAYPDVPVIRVVLDNLNTHRTASLYQTFRAPEARRIAKRLEFHYTPKHGSWLNMAKSSSACWHGPVCEDETAMRVVWKGPSTPAYRNATVWEPLLTGASPLKTLALNSTASTHANLDLTRYYVSLTGLQLRQLAVYVLRLQRQPLPLLPEGSCLLFEHTVFLSCGREVSRPVGLVRLREHGL